MRGELVQDVGPAEELRGAWDDLAVSSARPYSSPSWLLAWWRPAAPAGALLRVAAAFDGDELVGVAPFFALPAHGGLTRYRLLAAGASAHVEPLARAGRERQAGIVLAGTLAAATPRPDILRLEGVPATSPWPDLLAHNWPGRSRPWCHEEATTPAPAISLEGRTFAAWFGSKSRNFRQQMRRGRRQLEERGAVFRLASNEEELQRDLRAFSGLHRSRWSPRGGSGVLTTGVERMLADAGRELVSAGRLRVWSVDVDGLTIASTIFLAAGGEVGYWLGGFDEAWAAQRPSLQAILAAVEDAFERGERRFDLGPGAADYKYRFADGDEILSSVALVPQGPAQSRARTSVLSSAASRTIRREVAARLSPEQKELLKRLGRRARSAMPAPP